MSRGVLLLFALTTACRAGGVAPITRADDPSPVAPPKPSVTPSACGKYEGGKIGNYLVCFRLTRDGLVSSSNIDVGSPYDRKSDLVCGAPLRLWGVDYRVTCAQIPTTEPHSVPSTDFALERDGVKIPLLRRLNADDGWWANVKMIGEDAFITFRFHKLD